jgi:hypothetical protein
MSKQAETIQQLIDRINALEAICFDFLTLRYNNASQAQVKFDDYRIKYTQEAIDKREAEAREKMLKESLRAATAEFKERANASYWSLVFMDSKAQEKALSDIWSTATDGLELPKNAKQPTYSVSAPTEDQLMRRKSELESIIGSINETYCHDRIKHCEKSLTNATTGLEREAKAQVAKLRKDDKLTESEREQQIKETEALYNAKIRQSINDNKRHISSAKTELNRLQQSREELSKVKKALAELLMQ